MKWVGVMNKEPKIIPLDKVRAVATTFGDSLDRNVSQLCAACAGNAVVVSAIEERVII